MKGAHQSLKIVSDLQKVLKSPRMNIFQMMNFRKKKKLKLALCSSIILRPYVQPPKNHYQVFFNGGIISIDGTMGVHSGTHGVTGGTLGVPWRYLPPPQEKTHVCVFLYWCFYPHRSRYLVSSICGIFMFSAKIAKKFQPLIYSIQYILFQDNPGKTELYVFSATTS